MGLFDVFKKREVPQELPSLSFENHSLRPVQKPEKILEQLKTSQEIFDNSSRYKKLPVQKPEVWSSTNEVKKEADKANQTEERSFFRELIKDLTNEISSEKLDSKYKEKILTDDIVTQMKSYWENQKPEVFLQNAGKEIKEQLVKKAENLTEMEKDWQNAYFSLIAKEEKIRQEEKELKQMVSELIGIYEKSLSRRSSKDKPE